MKPLDGVLSSPDPDCEIVTTRTIPWRRERVFDAFGDPEQLTKWWGPKGFTSTFHEFDFEPGGAWRFILHGPDGVNYQNDAVFMEIVKPERIVLHHETEPEFFIGFFLEDEGDGTAITWRMRFKSAGVRDRIGNVAAEANEQNLDRLEHVLAGDW
jgi:uncharacterized protein YndB with AHSA1/START domain